MSGMGAIHAKQINPSMAKEKSLTLLTLFKVQSTFNESIWGDRETEIMEW